MKSKRVKLGPKLTAEQRRLYEKKLQEWGKKLGLLVEENRRSMQITGEDLATRINCRG